MILLRIAIGWHFHTEGTEKIKSYRTGDKPFSAEAYLKNSTGPLAPYFRGMLPDPNGLAKLDTARLKSAWADDVRRMSEHFRFDEDQKAKAEEELKSAEEFADAWFSEREHRQDREKYYHNLADVQTVERDLTAMSFERERASNRRKELAKDLTDLTKEIDARGAAMRDKVIKLATPEQTSMAGAYTPALTRLDVMNMVVTYGVWMIGLCLMLGFLTRFSALCAAAFLINIYLCIPPWPGYPESPKWEGHYYIVDKNLVEMLACMALVFLPTGYWLGLDALFFGKRRRRRLAAREARVQEREAVAA